MINLEAQKEYFKNHVATFKDFGAIKIMDFKNPESNEYRIRFLFEEDYCKLHITGDLGELIATNYNNMSFDKFGDFINDPGYFIEKIDVSSRMIYKYDQNKAESLLLEYIDENDLKEDIEETFYGGLDSYLLSVFVDYTEESGFGYNGYSTLWQFIGDSSEFNWMGRESTGIIELYLMAFNLARNQLIEKGDKK